MTKTAKIWKCLKAIWHYEPEGRIARGAWTIAVTLLGIFAPYIAYRILKPCLMEAMASSGGANAEAVWATVLLIPALAAVFAAFLELVDFLGAGRGWWPPLAAKSLVVGGTAMIVVVSFTMVFLG